MKSHKLDHSITKLSRVQPLNRAYNHILQVLLTRFHLERQGQSGGVKLEIEFDKDTPAIWNNLAKFNIHNRIRSFKRRSSKYQKELNDFLLKGIGNTYEFNDPSFPFRYASGGTLPIITMDRRKFYCLYYREIFPIGWNIVNGATDTIFELIDPQHAVKRELGEELLIVHPGKHIRYVFEWDTSEIVDWPGFTVARRLFQKEYPELNLSACKETKTRLTWSDGPDSLWVKYDSEEPALITNCYMNINATDFGIEIDRIANIAVDKDAIIFDGEISGKVPVGAPIGLFPVDEINNSIRNEDKTDFLPSRFFYNAKSIDYAGDRLIKTIRDRYLPRLKKTDVLSQNDIAAWQQTMEDGRGFDLCPVTRSLILRHVTHEKARRRRKTKKGRFDFFLSYARSDEKHARAVYEYLSERAGLNVFFSEITPMLTKFADEIRRAIHKSNGMIAIASKPANLRREGVMYEWITFLGAVEDGRKPKSAPFINFISGFGYDELPSQLSFHHAIEFDVDNISKGLRRLGQYLTRLKQRL